ncbi:YidH family protein [Myxococcus sp. AM010]|uniref:YidH family protein n=1 Tax=Myxococcus sp. AM010 TaxID=2745138 RepID=UPI0015955494|nr:DUF202 domain-containing protein [Myxococcus sp. AM010]NVJ12816.1 DUF202 domain-containing protein [Myxococcus sp. AM010]
MPVARPPARDARYDWAAERTLLAWVRTGLAMMGFGFVVARFGAFLRGPAALAIFAALLGAVLVLLLGGGLLPFRFDGGR